MIAKTLVAGALLLPVADIDFSFKDIQPVAIVINGGLNLSEPMVTIKFDGTIEFGKNYNPDEAARIFWNSISANAPCKEKPNETGNP